MITYSAIASFLLILGILLIVIAIGLYIKLDIYSVKAELNGRATKRQLRKLRRNFKTSMTSNSTGSFYNNSMSDFTHASTGTTGSFGNTPYSTPTGALYGEDTTVSRFRGAGSPSNQGTAISLEELGSLEQVEYRTGVFEEDDLDVDFVTLPDTVTQNKYHQLIILHESSNVRF